MITQLANLKQKQALVRLLMFSIVTIMVWIGLSIFHSQNQTQISPELQKLAMPLNPNIDADVLTQLLQKRTFTTADLSSFPINKIVYQSDGTEAIVRSSGGVNTLVQSSSQSAIVIPSSSSVTATPSATLPTVPTASAAAKTQ